MLEDVGERLLDDAIGGQVDRRGELGDIAEHGQRDLETRLPDLVQQEGQVRQTWSRDQGCLRLTLLRYQAGEVGVLEVVDAQTTLIQARNPYDDRLVRYRVALAALQTLTGILP